nr:hypothetical protein [Vibrio crassostreae]
MNEAGYEIDTIIVYGGGTKNIFSYRNML